ncbi:hypothetical protein [Nonlabens ulvanivorans]|uniref:Sensor histidine kinase n=1 Tax=Nonlabens ulvanivorans TaxID=906888 RepID=A0A084JX63_NONUL|nr:hypothetical protein [Nonlabens ulvanivorans]KEZ93547.1 hypothetical protein IL45_04880 [Nonlabens ulvanivorans]PRX14124.1 hypothetical protein LY02_01153 [Nonlabens ulvanivorans]
MNRTLKKIIAREFLFLIGTTILFFLILFVWISITESNYDKQNEIKTEIEIFEKKNQSVNKELLKLVYGKLSTEATYDEFVIDFKESLELQKLSYSKLETEADFNSFLKDALGENEIKKATEYKSLETKLEKTKKSIFNHSVSEDDVFRFGLTLFLIFFIFRYLIYGTKWSIKQLKE